MEERVLFNKGDQRRFLNLVILKLNCISLKNVLQFGFDIPYSTLKNYYSESLSLPKFFFDDLCYLAKIDPFTLNVKYLEKNWGQVKAGKKGIKTLEKKYPEEIKKWRDKARKNSPVGKLNYNLKEIKSVVLNEQLAEFIGVYLGDGTMTNYFIRISGDYRYDLSYFKYLQNLVFEIFGITSKISWENKNNTIYLTIYSKKICSLFQKEFKLKPGNKIVNQSIIPERILNNHTFLLACIRGLVDTDGYIGRRGRGGSQFCLQFTSHNKALLAQVYDAGKNLEIFTFGDSRNVGTNKWIKVVRFFEIIGSSNLRHIVRFYEKFHSNNTLYQREVVKYYNKKIYKDLELPFKLSSGV